MVLALQLTLNIVGRFNFSVDEMWRSSNSQRTVNPVSARTSRQERILRTDSESRGVGRSEIQQGTGASFK